MRSFHAKITRPLKTICLVRLICNNVSFPSGVQSTFGQTARICTPVIRGVVKAVPPQLRCGVGGACAHTQTHEYVKQCDPPGFCRTVVDRRVAFMRRWCYEGVFNVTKSITRSSCTWRAAYSTHCFSEACAQRCWPVRRRGLEQAPAPTRCTRSSKLANNGGPELNSCRKQCYICGIQYHPHMRKADGPTLHRTPRGALLARTVTRKLDATCKSTNRENSFFVVLAPIRNRAGA